MNRNRTTCWLLFAVLMIAFSASSQAQVAVGISVRVGPPALPVYEQPLCPGPGYIWTPGFWSWNDDDGYYWVPGTWVVAPVGMLWTPGYWGWSDGVYVFHRGYWGEHIGFYGGVNYGFGYGGHGFEGGEWRGGSFYYNRSVTNVNVTHVTNVYNKTVIVNNTNVTRVSYSGGEGGVRARPTHEEERAEHERHEDARPEQQRHEHEASKNRENFASNNHGRPAIAATARPAEFKGAGVVRAKAAGAPYHPPKISPKEARVAAPAKGASTAAKNNNNRPASHTASPQEHAKNNGGSKAHTDRPSTSPTSKNTMNAHNSNPPKTNASHPAPAPRHDSAPQQQASHSAPAPRHDSAPQQHASHSAPAPRQNSVPQQHASRPAPAPVSHHESAPHQSAPASSASKPEKHPGKGR